MEGTKLTGLWKNKTKDGKTYLSGNLGMSRLLVLPNDYERNEKNPDYNVLPFPQEKKDKPKNGTSVDLMERARNCVFWTPGLTMGAIAEEGLLHSVAAHEKSNGGPFPQRKSNLKGGRPMR